MKNPSEAEKDSVYFNGFRMAVNAGDVTMNLTLNGKEVIVLHASHNVAKTFGQIIEKAVRTMESKTGQAVMTLDELSNAVEIFPAGSLAAFYSPERDAEELILAKGSSLRIEDE